MGLLKGVFAVAMCGIVLVLWRIFAPLTLKFIDTLTGVANVMGTDLSHITTGMQILVYTIYYWGPITLIGIGIFWMVAQQMDTTENIR
jgi:hypothetical protein